MGASRPKARWERAPASRSHCLWNHPCECQRVQTVRLPQGSVILELDIGENLRQMRLNNRVLTICWQG
jgi:hypothetical protein